MKSVLTKVIMGTIVTVMLCTGLAQAQITNPKNPSWPGPVWPEIFEPNQRLMNLNIEMLDPNDWDVIRLSGLLWDDIDEEYYEPDNPDIYLIEVPAWFWADGEEHMKIKVAVRQKSNIPLGDANDRYFKIALKVDINQYYTEDEFGEPNGDPDAVAHWHGLSKLSLENGDDVDVVAEGLALNLHTMSSGPEGYGYDAWRGNWITLTVEDVSRGVYVNAEQRNKQFLENRNWIEDPNNTWMYKVTGEDETLMKVPDVDSGEVPPDYPDSPARIALNYTPFMPSDPAPDDVSLVADMNTYVDMQGMLAMAAISSFVSNPDSLFSHYQNTYFIDYNIADPCETRKRKYLPWDVDSIMNSVEMDIYDRSGESTTWQDIFLDSPTYRPQYNQITRDLMGSSLTLHNIYSFLDMMLPILHDALAADPYNQFDALGPEIDDVNERFNAIKTWYSDRIINLLDQTWWDEPAGTILLSSRFDGDTWNADWNSGNWIQDDGEYRSSYNSIKSDANNRGQMISAALDAGDANAIHVVFWIHKDALDPGSDAFLYYHNGTTGSNDLILGDFDVLGRDKEWLRYTDIITDSDYFTADFQVIFDTTPLDSSKEYVCIDDVKITKLVTVPNEPVISGYILNPGDRPISGVTVTANNNGGSCVTNANGLYELSVPYGWSGTITPTDPENTFNPTERIYSLIVIDHPQRWAPDYKGTSIYDFDANGYINFSDFSVLALAWQSSPIDDNWNSACDFDQSLYIDLADLASFVGSWLK